MDMRKDICFLNYSRWQCTSPMTQTQSKKVCCCSMGQAWGQPCEPCPIQGTSRYIHMKATSFCCVQPSAIYQIFDYFLIFQMSIKLCAVARLDL